jgi:hypothetical protein
MGLIFMASLLSIYLFPIKKVQEYGLRTESDRYIACHIQTVILLHIQCYINAAFHIL